MTAEEGPTKNGYHRLDDVQDPDDRSGRARVYLWVSQKLLANFLKFAPSKAEQLHDVYEVLRTPCRVYRHIRPQDDEEFSGWCYVGRINRSPPGRLFVVFVDGNGVVYEWGSESHEATDKSAPIGALKGEGQYGRFGAMIWDQT